jgi:4-amino-4-deoxy-L-arabinose transferase-like glycosyltransferase
VPSHDQHAGPVSNRISDRLARRVRGLAAAATSDRTAWALGALAFLVYVPGILWGLPHATSEVGIRGWDVDSVTAIGVLSEFHNLLVEAKADWWVAYPLFHYFVLAAVYAPYLLFLVLSGGLGAPGSGFPYGFAEPEASLATLALIGRLITLTMAVGTVVGVYFAGRFAWDERAGIVAAALLMLTTPMVYYGRTGNLDMPALFWMTLGLVAMARICRLGLTVRRGAVLGLLAALAVATKDQAYGAWVPALVLVCAFHGVSAGRKEGWGGRAVWAPIGALVGSGAVAYAVANGIVFAPGRFVLHVRFLLDYEDTFYNVAQLGLTHPKTLGGYALLSLDISRAVAVAAGPPLVLLGVAALAHRSTWSRWTVLLVSMVVGYCVLVIAPISHMQYRYALLPIVVLSLVAGRFLAELSRSPGPIRRAAILGGVLAIAWSGVRAVDLTYQMLADARVEAGRWLQTRLSVGDVTGYFGAVSQLPRIPAGVVTVRLDDRGEPPAAALEGVAPTFVIVAADWSSAEGEDKSAFLPESLLQRLEDGGLGYRPVLDVHPRRLLGEVPYLVFVNPRVRVFERVGERSADGSRGSIEPGPPRRLPSTLAAARVHEATWSKSRGGR